VNSGHIVHKSAPSIAGLLTRHNPSMEALWRHDFIRSWGNTLCVRPVRFVLATDPFKVILNVAERCIVPSIQGIPSQGGGQVVAEFSLGLRGSSINLVWTFSTFTLVMSLQFHLASTKAPYRYVFFVSKSREPVHHVSSMAPDICAGLCLFYHVHKLIQLVAKRSRKASTNQTGPEPLAWSGRGISKGH